MSAVKKIISALLDIVTLLIFIIFIFAIYSFAQINFLHKKYVNIFGYTFLQVGSGSMEDEIKTNDIIIDKLLKREDKLDIGDIISFEEEKSIITHRIISMSGDTIITKGDANNTQDDPISREQVIGKVIKIIPNISIWVSVFKTRTVYIMMTITFVLFMITISIDTKENKGIEDKKSSNTNESDKDTSEETSEKDNK